MKLPFKIYSIFLYLNFVSPVFMYYLYDGPKGRYGTSLDSFGNMINGISAFSRSGLNNVQRKYFRGITNQKLNHQFRNDHIVDSHFRILKLGPTQYKQIESPKEKYEEPMKKANEQIITKFPQNQEQTVQGRGRKDDSLKNPYDSLTMEDIIKYKNHVRNNNNRGHRIVPGINMRNTPTAQSYTQGRLRTQEYFAPVSKIESKGNTNSSFNKIHFVKLHSQKAQLYTDAQKYVHMNNHRQISVHGSDNAYRRVLTSSVVDKSFKDGPKHKDRQAAATMSHVLDDMTQKIADRRYKKGDYRKKDKDNSETDYERKKRKSISDNMKTYISKDVLKREQRKAEVAKIEDANDVNYTPYALFYRMNPEIIAHYNNVVLLESSVSPNTASDVKLMSDKKKKSSVSKKKKTKKNSQIRQKSYHK